jgi:hypothetical protein
MESNIKYKVSLYPSKYVGYNSKNKGIGKVTIFITTLWKWIPKISGNLDNFITEFINILILERICLERGFQKIRMKNRCKPGCKLEKYAKEMCREY